MHTFIFVYIYQIQLFLSKIYIFFYNCVIMRPFYFLFFTTLEMRFIKLLQGIESRDTISHNGLSFPGVTILSGFIFNLSTLHLIRGVGALKCYRIQCVITLLASNNLSHSQDHDYQSADVRSIKWLQRDWLSEPSQLCSCFYSSLSGLIGSYGLL